MPTLTLEDARTLLYFWEQGRKGDGFLSWGEAMTGIQGRWGFSAQQSATRMREEMTPRLLCARDRHPLGEDHCVHPALIEDPAQIFEALHQAEAALQMALTPIPDGVRAGPTPEPATATALAIAIGSIVATPDGPAEVILDAQGRPALRMLAPLPSANGAAAPAGHAGPAPHRVGRAGKQKRLGARRRRPHPVE